MTSSGKEKASDGRVGSLRKKLGNQIVPCHREGMTVKTVMRILLKKTPQ